MNRCMHCATETKNPMFCSRSCAASHNNVKSPKRSPEGSCLECGASCRACQLFCPKCRKVGTAKRRAAKNASSSNTKVCPVCKEDKPLSEYTPKSRGGVFPRCRRCNSLATMKAQRDIKVKAVEYLGGQCVHCGLVDDACVYDYHHTNPEEKDHKLSRSRNPNFERLKTELDKCILLCSNCHRKVHCRVRGDALTY